MKVALVHDFLIRLGGAERVLKVFSEMFPEAPIYTILYDEEKVGDVFPRNSVVCSRLQKLPSLARKKYKYLLPAMPRMVEEWDFGPFDLVISNSSAFVHGIITPTHTHHVCYVESPMRSLWDWSHEYLEEQRLDSARKLAAIHFLKKTRMWDYYASSRADVLIANSHNVRRRIKKYWRRDAGVIYPPVDLERFELGATHENFFLIISNLSPFKRIDLAVQLFNRRKEKLIVIGDGPQRTSLERMAQKNVHFLGYVEDEMMADYLKKCRALIFPGEEDFGITPVEAMACGKPILAFGKGGVTESVVAGVTGEFFAEPSVHSMEEGLKRLILNEGHYSAAACHAQAEKFSKDTFMIGINKLLY